MLLQRLREYAARLDLPPALYAEGPVRYVIDLDAGGRLLSSRPIDTSDPADRRARRGVRRLVPQIQRSSGIRPLLLADTAEYTLGLARDPAKQARVDASHAAYRDLVDRCADSTASPAVQAIADFLAEDPTAQLDLSDDFDRGAIVTFRVEGEFAIDLPQVQAFWAAEHDPSAADDVLVGQCLVCGRERPVLRRLQAKIKGVPGGQSSGTMLISANDPAFESYGLRASLIAPTCAECGELFTKGLNQLLAGEASRYLIGGVAFVWWTRDPVPAFDALRPLTDPEPAQVRALLESVHRRRESLPFDDTPFYLAGLSGSGGRTVVRDWLDTTVGTVRRRLAVWFERQRLIGRNGEPPEPLGLYALAASTVLDPRRDLAPPIVRGLLRAALAGTPPSWSLLEQAVRRNRAEQAVTRPRAALIKLVLLGQQLTDEGTDMLVRLDVNDPNPGYRCGRLLAVLESIQRAALPGINATIVQRFYGTASSAPASVFARLMRGAQPHLGRLERDRPGAYHALQQRLEDVLAGLGGFPATLTLEDQGRFALGYYHQRAHDRAQARARREGIDPETGEVLESDGDAEASPEEN